jgi:hypothetical protein
MFVPFSLASAAATALSGFLAERLGPRKPLMMSLGLLLAAFAFLHVVSTPFASFVYAAVLGASAGAQGMVADMVWAHYYGRRRLGRVQGPATMVLISAAVPVLGAVSLRLFDPKKARRETGDPRRPCQGRAAEPSPESASPTTEATLPARPPSPGEPSIEVTSTTATKSRARSTVARARARGPKLGYGGGPRRRPRGKTFSLAR